MMLPRAVLGVLLAASTYVVALPLSKHSVRHAMTFSMSRDFSEELTRGGQASSSIRNSFMAMQQDELEKVLSLQDVLVTDIRVGGGSVATRCAEQTSSRRGTRVLVL